MFVLLIIIILIILVIFASGYFMCNIAINRPKKTNLFFIPKSENFGKKDEEEIKNREEIAEYVEKMDSECSPERIEMRSHDSLKLVSLLYRNKGHKYIIAIHGYTSDKEFMRDYIAQFYLMGFNVLTPDNRAHGESEGKYMGMGYKDREDILDWINLIISMDKDAQIALYGLSMGAAAVMMVSGMSLPQNVKAIIEDCGYTSVWDIFSDEIKTIYHLPPFPVLYAADVFFRIREGFSMKKASSLEALKNSSLPILFIHGKNDTFVRFSMLERNFEAKTNGYKEKYEVDGASHALSYIKNPGEYTRVIRRFLDIEFADEKT